MSLRVLSMVTILLVAPWAATARGHWLNDLERWVGVGTSDGYHSRTACPPKRSHAHSPHSGRLPPTWASTSPRPSMAGPQRTSTIQSR
jgi:hypothetical protein